MISQTRNMPEMAASSAHPPLPRPSFTLIPASPTRLEASARSDEAPSEATLVQEDLPQSPPKTLQSNFQSFDLEQQSQNSQDDMSHFQGLY